MKAEDSDSSSSIKEYSRHFCGDEEEEEEEEEESVALRRNLKGTSRVASVS